MNSKLKLLLDSYYGIDGGNPNAPYWIMGVEYGQTFEYWDGNLPELFNTNFPNPFDDYNDWISQFPYYRRPRLIIESLCGPLTDAECNSQCFMGNLFPLAKRKINQWDNKHQEFTGFDNPDDYYNACREYGRPALHREFDASTGQKTIICGGLGNYRDFVRFFFEEDIEPEWEKIDKFYIGIITPNQHQKIKHLIIVPHFSGTRGITNITWGKIIRRIVELDKQ